MIGKLLSLLEMLGLKSEPAIARLAGVAPSLGVMPAEATAGLSLSNLPKIIKGIDLSVAPDIEQAILRSGIGVRYRDLAERELSSLASSGRPIPDNLVNWLESKTMGYPIPHGVTPSEAEKTDVLREKIGLLRKKLRQFIVESEFLPMSEYPGQYTAENRPGAFGAPPPLYENTLEHSAGGPFPHFKAYEPALTDPAYSQLEDVPRRQLPHDYVDMPWTYDRSYRRRPR